MNVARERLPLGRIEGSQIALIGLLLVLATIGWAVTDDRMAGMDHGPGTDPGTLGFYVGAWVVMMAAMMFPSITPMVLTYAKVQSTRRERGRRGAGAANVPLFVGGYLLAWTLFGLAAYGLIELVHSLDVDALSWDEGGPYFAGGVIVAAAIYQLTPAKDACLRRCRSPMEFVLGHMRLGPAGALRMGVEHGAWCVGCCWALMAALFALGVMSVGWMVFVAALIATEKLLPWKGLANRGIAVLLLVLGLAVAFAADDVPGLTEPGSAHGSMHGDGGSHTKGMQQGSGMKGAEMRDSGHGSGTRKSGTKGSDGGSGIKGSGMKQPDMKGHR